MSRLHDLWILLAWAGVLAAIMLTTFYHRNCLEFTGFGEVTAACQSDLDLALIFLAAIGAGIAFKDERLGVLGFLPVHAIASVLFIGVLMIPSSIGVVDPSLTDAVLSQIIVVAFNLQFPIAIFLSLVGGPIGMFLGGMLPKKSIFEDAWSSPTP